MAIVTGAAKGIGAAIAKGLGAAGAAVVVNYASSKEGADKVVAEIAGNGGKAVAIRDDVSRADDVLHLFKGAKDAFGKLDILVNNAGIFNFSPLEEVTELAFHREFNTNVLGPILTTQEALKHFGPGGRETEGTHTAGIIGSDFEKNMVAQTTLGRLGQPEDIARVAVFLASDDAAWITGERIAASAACARQS